MGAGHEKLTFEAGRLDRQGLPVRTAISFAESDRTESRGPAMRAKARHILVPTAEVCEELKTRIA
jgi:hypothetical protein